MKKLITIIIILMAITLTFSSSCWDQYIDVFENTLLKYHPILKENETKKKLMHDRINKLRNSINDETPELEIIIKMKEVINLLNDGHSMVGTYSSNFQLYPVILYPLGNDFIVWKIIQNYNYLLYSKLTAINNIPVKNLMNEFKRLVPHETEGNLRAWFASEVRKYEYLKYLEITDKYETLFTFEAEGKKYNIMLSPYLTGAMNSIENYPDIYKYEIDPVIWKYYKKEKAMYIRISTFIYEYKKMNETIVDNFGNNNNKDYSEYSDSVNQQFDRFDKDLDFIFSEADNEETEKFIIDIRGNRGGYKLWKLLLDRFYNRRYSVEKKGSIIILIDKYTYSSSVLFANEAKKNPAIIIIGEEPGEKLKIYGNPITKNLTILSSFVSVATTIFNDTKNKEYIKPDIEVFPNISDFKKGIDTVLEYALKYK